jgi:hypothetical protein
MKRRKLGMIVLREREKEESVSEKKITLDDCVGGSERERVKKKTLDDCDNRTH